MLNGKVDILAANQEEAMAQSAQNDSDEEEQRMCMSSKVFSFLCLVIFSLYLRHTR